MSELVKVLSIGLLALPRPIREQLNINAGDNLDVTIEAGKGYASKSRYNPKKTDWENEIRFERNTQAKDWLRNNPKNLS